ncbi:hypothetical protein HYZ76_01330 [Candidatus Falkowbacteria bacterium]|nr:hypothetical protein [Candidatus Falkowbacteria bacterium]
MVLVAIASLLGFCGCAVLGPYSVDGRVYNSEAEKYQARNAASQAYFQELEESYVAGAGGYVEQKGSRARAPEEYQFGVLINHLGRPVTFHIKGRRSAIIDVFGAQQEIELPAGSYWVEIYAAGSSWPYRNGQVVVDSERGDTVVNGQVYDFSIIAP